MYHWHYYLAPAMSVVLAFLTVLVNLGIAVANIASELRDNG